MYTALILRARGDIKRAKQLSAPLQTNICIQVWRRRQ